MINLLVTGTRYGRPDTEIWLDRWFLKFGHRLNKIVLCADDNDWEKSRRGVDLQAYDWSRKNNLLGKTASVYAHWKQLQKSAGPDRNFRAAVSLVVEMNDGERDWCLALPDERSKGTWNCHDLALDAGMICFVCRRLSDEIVSSYNKLR